MATRTAAQKRATRKLVALNKSRTAPVPSRKRSAARRSVASRVRTVYRNASTAVSRSYRRARKTNTALAGKGLGIVNLLKASGIGAAGALAIDLVYAKLPIPASMQTGTLAPVTKAAVTVGLGMLAGKVLSKPMAHSAVVGALTVQLHAILKNMAAGVGIAGYTDINGIEYYSPAEIAASGMSQYISGADGVGEYVNGVDGVDTVY